jgi:hypothetical protein
MKIDLNSKILNLTNAKYKKIYLSLKFQNLTKVIDT